jgi:hypothetical protein
VGWMTHTSIKTAIKVGATSKNSIEKTRMVVYVEKKAVLKEKYGKELNKLFIIWLIV